MLESLYHYRARVVAVIDGDTLDVELDLGLHVRVETRIRLYGLDTPELHAADPAARARAHQAKDFLAAAVATGEVLVETIRDRTEKYGRYLGRVWVRDGADWADVNARLLAAGLAVPYPD